MSVLSVNGVGLPAPVSIKVDDEIIWSSNTGRVSNAEMMGDVVGEKKTLSVEWGILKDTEMKLIKDKIIAGFYPLTFYDDGVETTITTYRGTLTKEQIGFLDDGIFWYRKASVKIIQK